MKKLAILGLFVGFASAEEPLKIYSVYNTSTDIKYSTSSVDIIKEEEIKEQKPTTLVDIVDKLSSISFLSNGGYGQSTSIYLRGMDPKRTLIMLDGIRLNDVTGLNGAMLEHILISDIEQIEIIKGSQSGVWGPDASAGVINIITKKPQKGIHLNSYFEYGSYTTKKYGTTITLANDKLDILFGLHRFDSYSISAAEPYGKRWEDLNMESDKYKNDTVNLKIGLNFTENDRFETSMRFIDAVVNYDGFDSITWQPADANNKAHINQKFYNFQYKKTIGNHKLQLYSNLSDFYRSYYEPTGWNPNYSYKGNITEFGFRDKWNYFKDSFIVYGLVRQDFKEVDSNATGRYHDTGYYFTNVNKFNNIILSQTVRYDNYSSFSDKFTYKVGGKYIIKEDIDLYANYGTSYNVPTIYQLYSIFGNRNLNPENSKNYDIGVNLFGFNLTYFKYKIDNLIDFNMSTFRYTNIVGTSTIKGVELSYKKDLKSLKSSIYVGYTNLSAKDKDDKDLPRRPKDKLDFNISIFPLNNFNIVLNGEYIGSRKDTNQKQTGFYTLLNCVINVDLNKYISGYLKVDNLTNRYYQTAYGYASFGRSVYAGIIGKF